MDAFYNIATTLDLQWVLPVFENSRSHTSGKLPYEITGLSDFLGNHCSAPKALIKDQNVIHINIDFNELVSGDRDAQKGALRVNGVSQEELFSNIKRGLIEAVETAKLELKNRNKSKRTNIFKLFFQLVFEHKSLPVIHCRFFINRLSLITKFSNIKKFSNALSEFNAKNSHYLGDSTGSLNIAMHLRKGDTTVFPLPDGRLVASWGDYRKENNRKALPEIIEKVSDSIYLHCDIEPYLTLIKKVADLSPQTIHLSFLCDGFDRGLNRIQDHMEFGGLSPDEMQYIKNWAANEEARLQKTVSDLMGNGINSVDIIWGENEELFERSFQTIKAADILLLSTGGFARSIFNYFNDAPDSIAIGPCTEETSSSDIDALTKYVENRKSIK